MKFLGILSIKDIKFSSEGWRAGFKEFCSNKTKNKTEEELELEKQVEQEVARIMKKMRREYTQACFPLPVDKDK